jgi:hypothetical protein
MCLMALLRPVLDRAHPGRVLEIRETILNIVKFCISFALLLSVQLQAAASNERPKPTIFRVNFSRLAA